MDTKKVINLYITYILNLWLRHLNTHFTLKNSLFGSVKLANNADPDKYALCLGDILDIYRNLMKGALYKIMFGLIKNVYGITY